MPKGVFVVFSNPSDPAREGDFNEWYDTTHVPDVLKGVDGLVAATRYRLADTQLLPQAEPPTHRYLVVYEVDSDDLDGTREQLFAVGGWSPMTDAMDWAGVGGLVYEEIAERRAS